MNTNSTASRWPAVRPSRRTVIGGALAALVASGTSACGDDTAAVGADETVLVSVSIAAPSAGPVYLANALGYFKDEGLKVEVKEIANASLQIATGKVQFGLVNTSTL